AAGIPLAIAPRRWKRLGDVVILRIPPEAQAHAHAMAGIYGDVLGARTVVQDASGIHGPLRLPHFEVLWGDGTETVYLEGGVRYALDAARLMLSPGNIEERVEITNRVRSGAVVADLFV